MTSQEFLIDFSNFLTKEFKAELLAEDIDSIALKILNDEIMVKELVGKYGNLAVALYYYFKEVLETDLSKNEEILLKLMRGHLCVSKSGIDYDKIEFSNLALALADTVKAKDCILKDNSETNLKYIYDVECDNLIIDLPHLKEINSAFLRSCLVKNIIINNNIDIKIFTNATFENSGIFTVEYKGKKYSKNGFLKLAKQERDKIVNSSMPNSLYIIRYVRNKAWGGKRYYCYAFARKSKRSGKYRIAFLSDMGSQGYSIAYFKSREDAEKAVGTFMATSYLEEAKITYKDIQQGFKEVEAECGINIFIKKGSPGDIVEEDLNESMTEKERKIKRQLCLYLRKEGFPRFADYLENFHVNLLTSEQAGELFVAAIDPEKGVVYLNPTIDIMAISVLLRHEIAHFVFKHREHMFAKLKALGITKPSELAYRLSNIAGDYHISNEIYDDIDKALVKGINKRAGELEKIVVDNQDAIGLVTEMDFPENPEYWNMNFDQLWDVFVKDYDPKDLNADYAKDNQNSQNQELSDDFIEGWNELVDLFNSNQITENELKQLLSELNN